MRDQLILFFVKREFRKLFSVTRDLKVLRDPWYHHSILRDFKRRESFEWLQSSIESDLDWISWDMEPWLSTSFAILLSWNTLSCVRTGYSKEYLTSLFSGFGKTKFSYPWSRLILYFAVREPRQRTPLYDPYVTIVLCNRAKKRHVMLQLSSKMLLYSSSSIRVPMFLFLISRYYSREMEISTTRT